MSARREGRVWVIGTGPGPDRWMTPETAEAEADQAPA